MDSVAHSGHPENARPQQIQHGVSELLVGQTVCHEDVGEGAEGILEVLA